MAKINFKPTAPLTGWLEYPLKGTMLEPPVLRLRLRPIDQYDIIDATIADGELRAGRTLAAAAEKAVAEWDLEGQDGKPLEVTDENKEMYLRPILGEQLKDKPAGLLLGIQIVRDARARENFLKN